MPASQYYHYVLSLLIIQTTQKKNPFVAVEFDTATNPRWDPPYDQVGIDVKSIATANSIKWLSSKDGIGYDADISYSSSSKNLSVTFAGYQDNVTKIKLHISSIVNLRDVLPEWVEFGFFTATGTLSYENHTLSSWSFNSTLQDLEEDSESRTGLVIGKSVGMSVLICVLGLARWRQGE